MVKYLSIFFLLALLVVASCSDDAIEQPHSLSLRLTSLANALDEKPTCDEKAETISYWIVTDKDKFESDRDGFKKSCPAGKSSSYKCMSHQLIASGRVEVALSGCKNNEKVKEAVVLLNQRAGVDIYGLHP